MFGQRKQSALDKYIAERNEDRKSCILEAILRVNIIGEYIKSHIEGVNNVSEDIDFVRFLIKIYETMDKFESDISDICEKSKGVH